MVYKAEHEININFTPRTRTGERLKMRISPEDKAKIVRRKWKATITDLNTGVVYLARSASCGLPRCMCDAVVTKP